MAQSLIVVSSYPRKGATHAAETVGVASYTKLLLTEISKQSDIRLQVLAEVLDQPATYVENQIAVRRMWRRNDLLSLWRAFASLLQTKSSKILIAFEINMFGGLLANLLVMLQLFLLKIFGKQVFLILHQAPLDLSQVSSGWIRSFLQNALLRLWYWYLCLVVHKVIVFEQCLAVNFANKAVVIPHLIPEMPPLSTQAAAKRQLGLDPNKKYAMVFGYLSPYKGIKELLEQWTADLPYELLIAGGINPNHINQPKIVRYVKQVQDLARQKNITVTGFVDESAISSYFTAVDVVILPYKTMFSSSGPLALSWSYGKPVLLSKPLEAYLLSTDIATALDRAQLKPEDLVFAASAEDLGRALEALNSGDLQTKFALFAKKMQAERKISSIGKAYLDLITA